MKAIDAANTVIGARRKKGVIRRNTTSTSLRDIHQNGEQTCDLCESKLSAGNSVWGSSERYMRQHRDRCEMASQLERDHYKQYGKWPSRRRR